MTRQVASVTAPCPGAADLPDPPPQPANPGTALDATWAADVAVNRAAAERRAATLDKRRSIKKAWQAAWLLKAVTCLDLTSLNSDDTPGRVHRLAQKARRPVRPDLLAALEFPPERLAVGAVCVYPALVPATVRALSGSGIPVAAVAAGFPHGLSDVELRRREVAAAVAAGAGEIDIVINRGHVLRRDWQSLYDEVQAFKAACPAGVHLKAILGTGDLGPLRNVARAARVAMMAGADVIKTSTGKEGVNATLPVSLVMVRQIRAYYERTGHVVGFKPAGGISSAKHALAYLTLMREELGRPWQEPGLFRIGASGLLTDIERQLDHHTTGRYAALTHQPMA